MNEHRLYGLTYSMWTEQARWALDHHIIRYKYIEHIPMITTPLLRLATRRFTGPISVPILVTGERAFTDSWSIVAYADRTGHRQKLIPFEKMEEVKAWHTLCDRAQQANRVIATDSTMHSEEAKLASLPDFFPEFTKNMFSPLADLAAAYLGMKYNFRHAIIAEEKKKVREVLLKIRKALDKKSFLLGDFSYADITAAATLEFVSPVSDKFLKLKPAIREAFTQKDLATEFSDLIEWRDKLYADKRGESQAL